MTSPIEMMVRLVSSLKGARVANEDARALGWGAESLQEGPLSHRASWD